MSVYSFADIRILSYKAEFINDIILDIKKYSEFLPWCRSARIISYSDEEIIAELVIAFKFFQESYKSRVLPSRTPEGFYINVEAISGPFKKLINFWQIKELGDACEVKFSIDFEFNSKLLATALGPFFSMAVNKMINAFESRARYLSTSRS